MISEVFSTINDSKIAPDENSRQFIKISVMLYHYFKEWLHSETIQRFIWVIEITSLNLNSEVSGGYYSILHLYSSVH